LTVYRRRPVLALALAMARVLSPAQAPALAAALAEALGPALALASALALALTDAGGKPSTWFPPGMTRRASTKFRNIKKRLVLYLMDLVLIFK